MQYDRFPVTDIGEQFMPHFPYSALWINTSSSNDVALPTLLPSIAAGRNTRTASAMFAANSGLVWRKYTRLRDNRSLGE